MGNNRKIKDDLEAVREISNVMEEFDQSVQVRILAWVIEREVPFSEDVSRLYEAIRNRGLSE